MNGNILLLQKFFLLCNDSVLLYENSVQCVSKYNKRLFYSIGHIRIEYDKINNGQMEYFKY